MKRGKVKPSREMHLTMPRSVLREGLAKVGVAARDGRSFVHVVTVWVAHREAVGSR